MLKKVIFALLIPFLGFFIYLAIPNYLLPDNAVISWVKNAGPPSYSTPPSSEPAVLGEVEDPCPEDILNWRQRQKLEGVWIRESKVCKPDNPYEVAAFVRGTNKVSHGTLMQSGLAPDAVVKGKDLDGDGDPDEIHIRLEVMELNGRSPDDNEPITTFDIAPGLQPGFWVFAPKTFGMSTENLETMKAKPVLRVPSPVIRVEQGDTVKITLENTHYLPHTIHLHGVDHPFVDENGEGN
ncbi:MAG: multicopper oxidase domain-containing protein, partial [Gammaproteobacteria bacterium]|nr:multicopper oxidase domain-containing protein [Gammaproteobacteria bacterium]